MQVGSMLSTVIAYPISLGPLSPKRPQFRGNLAESSAVQKEMPSRVPEEDEGQACRSATGIKMGNY